VLVIEEIVEATPFRLGEDDIGKGGFDPAVPDEKIEGEYGRDRDRVERAFAAFPRDQCDIFFFRSSRTDIGKERLRFAGAHSDEEGGQVTPPVLKTDPERERSVRVNLAGQSEVDCNARNVALPEKTRNTEKTEECGRDEVDEIIAGVDRGNTQGNSEGYVQPACPGALDYAGT
jgi:hypothetical protein